jgi:hypothetical protein
MSVGVATALDPLPFLVHGSTALATAAAATTTTMATAATTTTTQAAPQPAAPFAGKAELETLSKALHSAAPTREPSPFLRELVLRWV